MWKIGKSVLALAAVAASATLTACGGSGENEDSAKWRTATSVEDGGGMDALVAAAQAEGEFNTMGLYDDWANYGEVLQAFSDKYGIKLNNDVSSGASQDLINAVVNRRGQSDSLDYLDTGMSFAESAVADGLVAEYYPEKASDLPDAMKKDGYWYNHLGGNMAIGCDASRVAECPGSWADLLDPKYQNQVALTGDPTTGESMFMAVFAAALANGGSLDDIKPGVDFFGKLSAAGNLVPVAATDGTIETGETPIVINWDYLQAPSRDTLKTKGVDWQIVNPSDGTVSSYYAAWINEDAPHPAVARLFMEFLFSDEGQNLLMKGYVKPGRLAAMVDQGTADQEILSRLPESSLEDAPQPTLEQRESQHKVLMDTWAATVK